MQHALLVVVIVLVCLVDRVSAQNTGFLPGDAFFHAVVTEASVDKVSADSEVVLEYIRPNTEEGSFSGYAGYWKLRLPTGSSEMVSRLKAVYKSIRLSVPKEMREYRTAPGDSAARAATEIVETNGLHVFLYNADYDCRRYALGLRYNETWVEDTASFGPNPKSVRLEMFVNDRDAFSADWRDATRSPNWESSALPSPTKRDVRLSEPAMPESTSRWNYKHRFNLSFCPRGASNNTSTRRMGHTSSQLLTQEQKFTRGKRENGPSKTGHLQMRIANKDVHQSTRTDVSSMPTLPRVLGDVGAFAGIGYVREITLAPHLSCSL